MTATVGGLWDSLLAEGKPWWITANSDSHKVYLDIATSGGGDFDTNGRYADPVYAGGTVGSGKQRLLARLLQPYARGLERLLVRRG